MTVNNHLSNLTLSDGFNKLSQTIVKYLPIWYFKVILMVSFTSLESQDNLTKISQFYLQLIMIFLKDEQNLWSTRSSGVNPNTVIENLFLETFFKNLLSDVLSGKIQTYRQRLQCSNLPPSAQKTLADSLFEVTQSISLREIVRKLKDYLMAKSPSFTDGELNSLLEIKYSNSQALDPVYSQKEILLVDVKIKADLQMVEKIPQKMKQMLKACQNGQHQNSPIFNALKEYKGEYINFVVVYFGYYNFGAVDKSCFDETELSLFGRTFKLRINVIYVSKVALMETFKTINKVPNLEELNELIIELYEFKRAKLIAKRKRQLASKVIKNPQEKEESSCRQIQKNTSKYGMNTVLGLTAVGVGVVMAIGKIFR